MVRNNFMTHYLKKRLNSWREYLVKLYKVGRNQEASMLRSEMQHRTLSMKSIKLLLNFFQILDVSIK
jgi:hypothetical protein